MPFVLKLSVTAPVAVLKTRLRSKELPCFCTIPNATKPFFKQWFIHAIDVTRIMTISYAEARQVMTNLRSFLGKAKSESITVEEFCAFTGVGKSYVRMHLVSRVMEGELQAISRNTASSHKL
ncbi:hypothetical protein A4H97_23345 [Niastella yeongjuensis]|uniref:Uncharacterized protein n=1 Tax=Niastella yeongjuensis TaxID=354355 RepID=A0A1V9F546_9BACT|nr:hypothetical protein [Niastella yeongjuensis]OQP53387.1 hypothetical protein A4H97_23345 [Niastella yeongjuensis]SEP13528.1 hypothetical protein SAMN05660816_04532 [Niastella yeongjuensis]